MAHFQIEWLIIEWSTKLNGSLLNDSLSLSSDPPRIECRAEREEPGLYSAPVYRRRDFFLKFGGVTVFRVFPCFVYPRTQNSCVFGFPSGTEASNMASSFELVVGQKQFLAVVRKLSSKVNSRTWGCGWWRKVFILFWSIGMKLSLLIVILTGTLAGSKRQFS